MSISDVAFWLLSGLAVASALGAVMRRDLVLAALNLVMMMLALAGIFLLLSAPFLAALQVIVYSGAIMVLFIFAIMLLNAPEDRAGDAISKRRRIGACAAAAVFLAAITVAIARTPEAARALGAWDGELGTPSAVSGALLDDLAMPFEAVSVLLTAAMLGAVMLARRKRVGEGES